MSGVPRARAAVGQGSRTSAAASASASFFSLAAAAIAFFFSASSAFWASAFASLASASASFFASASLRAFFCAGAQRPSSMRRVETHGRAAVSTHLRVDCVLLCLVSCRLVIEQRCHHE